MYYVVGNHDLVLEHFLDSILTFTLSPFLNVASGDARIRIEHGHLYDPFFARYPDLYELATRLAGLALFLRADVYRLWTWLADRADRRRRRAGRRRPHRGVVLPRRGRDAPAARLRCGAVRPHPQRRARARCRRAPT